MGHWCPSKYLASPETYSRNHVDPATKRGQFVLVVLNQPILLDQNLFATLWANATYTICADGGSNRLYDYISKGDLNPMLYLPSFIRGDMDSIKPHVREFYTNQGVSIEMSDCQESTDFLKCIYQVRDLDPVNAITSDDKLEVVALGGVSGRFDQTMSSVHHLQMLSSERRMALISEASILIPLPAGVHYIRCDLELEGPTCGILPVGVKETYLTTKGLKWDVTNWHSAFGARLSTSNWLEQEDVEIKTTEAVIWTTEMRKTSS